MLTHSDLEYRKHIRNDFLAEVAAAKGSAYASGEVLGGAIEIGNSASQRGPSAENNLASILQSIAIIDPDGGGGSMDLLFFNAPIESSVTDAAALSITADELKSCIAVVSVLNTQYVSAGGSMKVAAGANQANLGHVMKPAADGTSIYCIPVMRGAATYTNKKVQIRFQFSHGL